MWLSGNFKSVQGGTLIVNRTSGCGYNTSLPTTQHTTVTTPLPPHMEVRQAGGRIGFLCREQLLEPRSYNGITTRWPLIVRTVSGICFHAYHLLMLSEVIPFRTLFPFQ
jgi:hypothetical protein